MSNTKTFREMYEKNHKNSNSKLKIDNYQKIVEEENMKQKKLQEQKKQSIIQKNIQKYFESVPERFKEASFENYIGNEKERMLVEKLTGGILYGPNGNGKTHLGYAACRKVVLAGGKAELIRVFDLMVEIKNEFNNPGTIGSTVDHYAKLDYLVLDECDKFFNSQTEYLSLVSLINKRYETGKPTLAISNAKNKSEIATYLSISCFDKLRDGEDIPLMSESMRGRVKQIELANRQSSLRAQ